MLNLQYYLKFVVQLFFFFFYFKHLEARNKNVSMWQVYSIIKIKLISIVDLVGRTQKNINEKSNSKLGNAF